MVKRFAESHFRSYFFDPLHLLCPVKCFAYYFVLAFPGLLKLKKAHCINWIAMFPRDVAKQPWVYASVHLWLPKPVINEIISYALIQPMRPSFAYGENVYNNQRKIEAYGRRVDEIMRAFGVTQEPQFCGFPIGAAEITVEFIFGEYLEGWNPFRDSEHPDTFAFMGLTELLPIFNVITDDEYHMLCQIWNGITPRPYLY